MGVQQENVFTDDMDNTTTAAVPISGPGVQPIPTGWVQVGMWNQTNSTMDWFYFASTVHAQTALQQGVVK